MCCGTRLTTEPFRGITVFGRNDLMTEQSSGGGGTAMAFIIGAVVVVLAIVAWVVFSGGMNQTRKVEVDVDLPAIEAPSLPAVEPPTVPSPTSPAG
jgi:hypothetical protein